ncbi:MAG TPA: hypothetical protein VM818_23155 [Vicinamibacterales bacterium]|jgi:hypothetical protein|nr:hypothetical protein [Vicinamibacterales bacterium]
MVIARKTRLSLAALVAPLLMITACGVNVGEGQPRNVDVDIRTTVGGLLVRTGVDVSDTGLPVYPGANPLRDNEEPPNANVSIGTPLFGMDVVAAKFQSDDPPETIVAFYRKQMRAYGDVTECRGDTDFKGRSGSQHPVCRERRVSRAIQLIVGSEERHRLVSVRPRGSGSEFAVVYIHARG